METNYLSRTVWVPGRSKTSIALGLLAAMTATLVAILMASGPAQAVPTTFTVNSTLDTGDASPDGTCDTCTLREAIQEANANNNPTETDTINFAIAGNGPHTISPTSVLPTITQAVTIDGYTQGDATADAADDAVANTIPLAQDGTNAVLKIELNGQGAGSGSDKHGLTLNAPNVVIKGLVINRFEDDGIRLFSQANRIEGNFIGTNPAGDTDLGNGFAGIGTGVATSNGQIGGTAPAARNLISGNNFHGVNIASFSSGYKVEGNLIGTEKDGTSALRNSFQGVAIGGGSNNTVGGTEAGAANVIAFNGGRGVLHTNAGGGGTGTRILSNSIFSNDQLGIDLQGGAENTNGVTANDPKDPDTGPNNLQNYPVLASATTDGTTTTITGKLNSRPRKTFTIQFFSSTAADPSANGEGKTFLGEIDVKTSRTGNRSFSVQVDAPPPGEHVATATATNKATGDTSEFSNAVAVT